MIYINVPKNQHLKKLCACKLCILLYTKQLFVYQPYYLTGNQKSDLLSTLQPNAILCYLYMGVLLCFSYILGNLLAVFLVDIITHNFPHLKLWEIRSLLAFSLRKFDFQEKNPDGRWLFWSCFQSDCDSWISTGVRKMKLHTDRPWPHICILRMKDHI